MSIMMSDQNLFEMEPWCMFANMVSADNNILIGTSLEFEKAYGIQGKLNKLWADKNGLLTMGESYLVDNVYNLVVKKHGDDNFDFDSFRAALIDTKTQMEYYLQKKLVIPCTFDLDIDMDEWDKKTKIIKEIFNDTDIDVVFCL